MRFGRRGFVGEFHRHKPGDEFLASVQVEINRGAFGIRMSYYPEAVLTVLDKLPLRECSHRSLLSRGRRFKLRVSKQCLYLILRFCTPGTGSSLAGSINPLRRQCLKRQPNCAVSMGRSSRWPGGLIFHSAAQFLGVLAQEDPLLS